MRVPATRSSTRDGARREVYLENQPYPINPGNQVAIGWNQNTAASSSRLITT